MQFCFGKNEWKDIARGQEKCFLLTNGLGSYASLTMVGSNDRNTGIGKILMRVVDKVMRQNNVKTLRLHTSAKATAVIRFYYGRGFYISDVEYSRGYPRAELIKEY